MRALPTPAKLAALFSEVTSTMLDVKFELSDTQVSDVDHLCWRSAVLSIGKDEFVGVALASDQEGCRMLGAKMFRVSLDEVDESMVDDTLRELVNMTGGMVKRALALDALLGLPRILSKAAPSDRPIETWTKLVLRGGGAELVLFVSPPQHADGKPA
jgi:hypothetical protein